jgi:hypothetical protein
VGVGAEVEVVEEGRRRRAGRRRREGREEEEDEEVLRGLIAAWEKEEEEEEEEEEEGRRRRAGRRRRYAAAAATYAEEMDILINAKSPNPITYKDLTEFRTKMKGVFGYLESEVEVEKVLTYAEEHYVSSRHAAAACLDNCQPQNISFLLELLFKKRQYIFLDGKKYSIVKFERVETDSTSSSNTVIVKLVVLDPSKPQRALAYYDCEGRKKILKDRLAEMFPSVFNFFDIDSPPYTTNHIYEIGNAQLLEHYKNKRDEYRSLSNKNSDTNDEDRLDKLAENLEDLENILVTRKSISKGDALRRRTRRYRPQYFSPSNDGGMAGGRKKNTRKNNRQRRMSRKKRARKNRRVTNKNI